MLYEVITKGIVEAMDITGTPIYFKLDKISSPELKNNQTEAPKVTPKSGLYYCLPGKTNISIVDKNKELIRITSYNVCYTKLLRLYGWIC